MKKNMKNTLVLTTAAALMAMTALTGCSALGEAPTIASEEAAADTEADTEAAAETAEAESSEAESGSRLEAILERGYLEVVTEPYFAPYEFIDPSKPGDEQYVGADMELAKYIAEKLGVECKIIPLEFEAVLTGITEAKYDMAISALAYTPARAEAMEMSKGYKFSDEEILYGLMIREEDLENIKSADDLADKTIVYQSGSLQEQFAKEQVPACKEEKRVSATTDGFLMVQEGKADAVITAVSTAELYIAANDGCGMVIVPDFKFEIDESTQGERVCMPKGETELLDAVNEIIDEVVESGIYDEWYDEYEEYAKSLGL